MPPCSQAAIRRALHAARAAWPGIAVTEPELAGWMARAGIDDAVLGAHGSDLVLAAACALGDRRSSARSCPAFPNT